jgi:hypothetical protein
MLDGRAGVHRTGFGAVQVSIPVERRRVAEGDDFAISTMPAPIRAAADFTSLALAQN